MKRFMIIAVTAALAWFGWGACTLAQEAIVMTPTTISRTVVRGPLGFVRYRASSVSPVQACAPIQACAPAVEACAPAETAAPAPVEACAPVVTTPACAPVVEACAPVTCQPVVCAPVKIKSCFSRVKKVKEVVRCRPRILPSQVIRTRTVVR